MMRILHDAYSNSDYSIKKKNSTLGRDCPALAFFRDFLASLAFPFSRLCETASSAISSFSTRFLEDFTVRPVREVGSGAAGPDTSAGEGYIYN